jgi:predicted dinucleotide-binding enzyme
MKIGILGTGMVGAAIGTKLASQGHQVKMGSRSPRNEKAVAWAQSAGANASFGTFAEAASFGEVLFNCTKGDVSIEVIRSAGAGVEGKALIDVANPLDFSKGMPPSMTICNTDSLGEQIQRAFPKAKVVKTLNTLNCQLMVNPAKLSEQTDVFVSGNDSAAKAQAVELLKGFGWNRIHDLGDITTARGTEMWLPLWVRLMGTLKTADFNLRIVAG